MSYMLLKTTELKIKKLIKQELQIQKTDLASAGAMHFYPAMAEKKLKILKIFRF